MSLNDQPFTHHCHNGSYFSAARCDFSSGVTVSDRPECPLRFGQDVAEMIGYHACNIHPKLNGFQGYDTFTFTDKKPD